MAGEAYLRQVALLVRTFLVYAREFVGMTRLPVELKELYRAG